MQDILHIDKDIQAKDGWCNRKCQNCDNVYDLRRGFMTMRFSSPCLTTSNRYVHCTPIAHKYCISARQCHNTMLLTKCEFMEKPFSQIFLISFAAKSVICAVEPYKLPLQKDKYTSYLVWPVNFPLPHLFHIQILVKPKSDQK